MTKLIELTHPKHRYGDSLTCPGVWKTKCMGGACPGVLKKADSYVIIGRGPLAADGDLRGRIGEDEVAAEISAEILEAALCQVGAEPVAVASSAKTPLQSDAKRIADEKAVELAQLLRCPVGCEDHPGWDDAVEQNISVIATGFEESAAELFSVREENARLKDELGILRHRFQIQEEINHNLREVVRKSDFPFTPMSECAQPAEDW